MGYNSVADIFIRLAVVASQSRKIRRNSDKMWPYSSSRSSKVIDIGVNGKPVCDFLKIENCLPTPPLFDVPLGVTPFEFCDEIWPQKTRIVGLSCGEEIMTL